MRMVEIVASGFIIWLPMCARESCLDILCTVYINASLAFNVAREFIGAPPRSLISIFNNG